MSSRQGSVQDLRLYGEQISLSSRCEEQAKKVNQIHKSRPRSALYSSSPKTNTSEDHRRPFSAGTEPKSPTLHSFLRRAQTDRVDNCKTTEFFRDYSTIPGSTQSALLFDKLVRDPIERKSYYSNLKIDNVKSKYKNGYAGDEMSENSSVDTCISLGTKIKERAELTKMLSEKTSCLIEGNSIKLKKAKPSRALFFDKLIEETSVNETHLEEKKKVAGEGSMKLSIYVPNSKDENTSSGVSSSSDVVQNLHTLMSPKRSSMESNGEKRVFVMEDIPNRLSRSKKSPHINWFPESLSPSREDLSRKSHLSSVSDANSKLNPLEGRVSFGNDAFQSTSCRDDIDNEFDSYPLFNTQLSLVEEESSQDSDLSPNQMSLHNGVKVSDDKHSDKNTYITKPNGKYRTSITQNDEAIFTNDHIQNVSDEDEMEKKFKALEYKYRGEKLIAASDYKYTSVKDNAIQAYPWTSLENIVSKENVEEKVMNNFTSHNSKDEIHSHKDDDNAMYSISQKNKELPTSSCFSQENSMNVALSSLVDDHSKINASYHFNNELSINDNMDLRNMSNQVADDTKNIPIILIDGVSEEDKKKILTNDNTVKDSCSNPNQCLEKSEDESKNYMSLNYPKYLQESDTKLYTSKVIEDYKREIATINNFHELTLKDLRKKCNDFYLDKNNYQTKPNPDITLNLSTNSKDDSKTLTTDSIVCDDSVNETKRPKENNIMKYYLNKHSSEHLNKSKFQPVDVDLDVKTPSDDSSLEQFAKDFFDSGCEKNSTKVSKPKLKKKIKRKDKTANLKPKSETGNDSTDTKYETKKTRYESRRLLKSAPPTNKPTTSCVKFKAQKITLSKCKTNFNRPLYPDADRDIVSWMASIADTPFEETSSCDNTVAPTPDLINPNKSEVPIKIIHSELNDKADDNDLQTEHYCYDSKQLTSPKGLQDVTTEDKKEYVIETKNIGEDERKEYRSVSKNKEVSFNLASYTPSVDEDGSFNDWEYDENDGNNLNGLLENDAMVTDIYSVLKDIENHKESVQNETNKSNSNDISETTTTEYKDIVDFLEKVENSANEEMSSLSYTQPPFALKVEELMELSKGELAHRAVAGALAAHKAGATAAKLRAALAGAARRAAARVQHAHKQARQRSAAAAQNASHAITRHQKFIEQLISEKRSLTERIEQVVGAAGAAETRRVRAENAAAERLQLELRNQRQRLQAQHHRERQAWLKQHTQKIKEMTVKGLEGELRAMEDAAASRVAAAQLAGEQALQREREQHAQDMRRMRDQAARDMEDQRDKERLAAAERLEHKRLEWESALSGAAERAGAESREAARRAEEAGRGARREAELWLQQQRKELAIKAEEQERMAKDKRNAMEEELSRLRENITKDLDVYKEEYDKKQTQVFKTKEMELRASLRRERDREIEKAVDCLEREAQEGKREMQENIRRMKEKYEEDMKSLETLEKAAISRCKEAREQLRESQEECALKLITITQLEGKLKQAEELKLQSATQSELLVRAATMKGREETEQVRSQLKSMQQQHKDEMHQLYAKVKVAVSRKDDALTAARRDAHTLRERCMRLEARLTNN